MGADAAVIDLVERVEAEAFATDWALPDDDRNKPIAMGAGVTSSGSSLHGGFCS